MAQEIFITKSLSLPVSELRFRFARSGGPGGQNVNKVETRVDLLFDVRGSKALNERDRQAITQHLASHIDSSGELCITSQESRSQWKNREAAVKKFVLLLQHALRPRKKRIATKAHAGAKEKRLEAKKRRSSIKKMRRYDD